MKYFCDLFRIIPIKLKPSKLDIIAVIAINQFVANIMMIEPINSVMLVTRVARLWFML